MQYLSVQVQYIDIYYHINIHIHIYETLHHISVRAQYRSIRAQYRYYFHINIHIHIYLCERNI